MHSFFSFSQFLHKFLHSICIFLQTRCDCIWGLWFSPMRFFIPNSMRFWDLTTFEKRMYVCMYACLPIYLSTYLPIYLSTYLSIYLPIYLCLYLSMYLCIYVSMYVCIYVSMSLCIYVSVYLCIYVSMYLCVYAKLPCFLPKGLRSAAIQHALHECYTSWFVQSSLHMGHAVSHTFDVSHSSLGLWAIVAHWSMLKHAWPKSENPSLHC